MEGRGACEVTELLVRVDTDRIGSTIVLYGSAGGHVWASRGIDGRAGMNV
jgi:hypothetical protein